MSLFDSISNRLAQPPSIPFSRNISSPMPGQFGNASGSSVFANAAANLGHNMASSAAMGLYNRAVNPGTQQLIGVGARAANNLLTGNFDALGLQALSFLPGGANAAYFATPTPLFGGISPAEARGIYDQIQSTKLGRKNLFLVQVSSPLFGDISSVFNLFATELDYSPYPVSGEKIKIGAAHIDSVNSSDPTELRITTMDDIYGTLKQWFAGQATRCAAQDGTVGVPADYAIIITVLHSFITEDSGSAGYQNIGYYRAANIDTSLSRRDNGLEELQMTFAQLDTFMPVPGA